MFRDLSILTGNLYIRIFEFFFRHKTWDMNANIKFV